MATRQGNRRWPRTAAVVLAAVPSCLLALVSWDPAGAAVPAPAPLAAPADLLPTVLTSTTLPGTPPPTSPPLTLPAVTLPPVSLPVVTVPPVTVVAPVTVPPLAVRVPAITVPGQPPTPGSGSAGQSTPPPAEPGGAATVSSPPPSGPASPAAASPDRRPGPAVGGATRLAPSGTTPPVTGPLPLRLRRAASESARQLSFPLGLAAAILAFLVLQPRLGRGDLSVAHPGTGNDDDLLGFS